MNFLGHRFSQNANQKFEGFLPYSEVPNRQADLNKRAGLEKSATLLTYLCTK